MGQNSIKALFFARTPLQELEEGPRSGPHLLVKLTWESLEVGRKQFEIQIQVFPSIAFFEVRVQHNRARVRHMCVFAMPLAFYMAGKLSRNIDGQ